MIMKKSSQYYKIRMKSSSDNETDKYHMSNDHQANVTNNNNERSAALIKNEDVPSLDLTDRDSFLSSFSSDAQNNESLILDDTDKYFVVSPSPISKDCDNDISFNYEPYSSTFFNDIVAQERNEQIPSLNREKKMKRSWYDPFFNFLDSICTTNNNRNNNSKHSIKEIESRYGCHEICKAPEHALKLHNSGNFDKATSMNLIQKYSKKKTSEKEKSS